MEYKFASCPPNVNKGKTPEGYSNAESTQLCAGKQINDSLTMKYKVNHDYRAPYGHNYSLK